MVSFIDKPVIIKPDGVARGDNARVEVFKDLNSGCSLVIKDASHPGGWRVQLSPQNAVGIALMMLEAAGVPIQATMAEKLKGSVK